MNSRLLIIVMALVSHGIQSVSADTKILVVGSTPDHPYGSHMYEFEGKLLVACLEQQNSVQAEYVPSWPPTPKQLADTSAVAFYSSPAGSQLLAPTHRESFDQLMQSKCGFVAIHWATGVGYDKVTESPMLREQFRGWLGGWFRRPPCDIKVDEAKLRMVADNHPIGRGWTDSVIRDEFYLNPVLHDNAQPLLRVTVDGKDQVVGWTFQREGQGGRSVGITLGHFHHNFARDDFRQLLVNSIIWSARAEIPADGCRVKVPAIQLQLPKSVASQSN